MTRREFVTSNHYPEPVSPRRPLTAFVTT